MAAKMEEKLTQTTLGRTGGQTVSQANNGQSYTGLKATPSYTPSDNVFKAKQYLEQVSAGKPGDYNSNYKEQLSGLYEQIMNRPKFNYDLNGDMLYQQYKDQYQTAGKQAMQDTMGQAAALTGGYGSSYAATAGNQAYQGYLQKLNSIIPDLYDRAYSAYQDQGTALQNQYALTQNADALDYSRYQDRLNQWNTDRSFAQNAYDSEYSRDYAGYQDAVNQYQYDTNMAWQQQQYERSQAYDTAMSMLQNGAMPSEDLLTAAGVTLADAQAYYNALHPAAKSGRGGRSSKKAATTATKGTNVSTGVMLPMTLEELGVLDAAKQYGLQNVPGSAAAKSSAGGMTKFQSEYVTRAADQLRKQELEKITSAAKSKMK